MKMSTPENDHVLQLRNLEKRYGDVWAVRGVSLEIRDGEFLTLLGPSGSGKTTILLMIAGFEYPTRGQIVLRNKSINLVPPEKRDIGMVFQNYALFPHMTIFENIAFPLRMRNIKRQEIERRVKEALDLVQLQGYEHRYPKQLSGGQQQRIALARAVVFNPRVLLMDEPLGALDKKLREHMQLEIKHIQSQLRRTVIYVTHDQEEALVMSDRIAVMNEGRIEQVGTPEELYEKPANRFVAGFIGESNFIEGRVVGRRHDGVTIRMDDQSEVRLTCKQETSIGEDVSFGIRPEKMFILDGQSQPDNVLEGVVTEVIYAGGITRYKITVGEEKIVYVTEMNVRMGNRRRKGERVHISWDRESLRKL